MATDERFVFLVDFFDEQAELIRKYSLSFFSSDNTIEMYDVKNKRSFLKRTLYPDLKIDDLRIGKTI
jgi:nucleoside-diphosphate kinase